MSNDWIGRDFTNFLTICLAFPSDLAALRSGIAFHVVAMFQTARFLVFGAGTSILPAVLLLVPPVGIILLKRLCRGLLGLLALHASMAELEHTMALTASRPAFLSSSSTLT